MNCVELPVLFCGEKHKPGNPCWNHVSLSVYVDIMMKFWSALDLNLCSGKGGGFSCPSCLWNRSVACQIPELTKTACRRDLRRLQFHQDQPWSLSYDSYTQYVLSSYLAQRLPWSIHWDWYTNCISESTSASANCFDIVSLISKLAVGYVRFASL